MRARELYFYTHPAITVVLQDINREDSVKWKSDLITFYFKKKTSLFFKSLTFSARKHWSGFINKTRHNAKPLIQYLSLHICLSCSASLASNLWIKHYCRPWLRSLLHMSLASWIINQAHTLIFWFLQLLVDKRWNQNHGLDTTLFFFFLNK